MTHLAATSATIQHTVSSYDPAVDAAHAAWAGVHASWGAAAASVAVGLIAVLIAFLIPWAARRTRIRASIFSLGYALGTVWALLERLKNTDDEVNEFLQEYMDLTEVAVAALDRFFSMAVDDGDLVFVALNLQSGLIMFRGYIAHGIRGGSEKESVTLVRRKYNEVFERPIPRLYKRFRRASLRFWVREERAIKDYAQYLME
jgi:hypothetical protein